MRGDRSLTTDGLASDTVDLASTGAGARACMFNVVALGVVLVLAFSCLYWSRS